MMQNAYLCIILHDKHKKLPFIAVSTRFLIIGKIQDGGHCWWHHRLPAATPPNKIYLILLRRSKAFHWRQNRFEILQHIKNAGEGSINPLFPCGGMNLRVRPRVKCAANRGTYKRVSMGWCLLRLSVKILALLRLSVNFLQLRLTKKLKINFFCFKKLNIN